LTDDGWRVLADYGVRSAIDLRGASECGGDPAGDPPIDVVAVPMPGEDVPAVVEWRSMTEAYLGLLERFQPELARVATVVSRADAPVVVHCHGGRDRAGLASALMLRLAGVPLEEIGADHALSDENWGPYNQRWYDEAPDDRERERRRRVTAPAGQTMAEILADLDARAFLLDGGASVRDLDMLVVRLTTWS
jgi:hypothetical protein